MRASTSIDIANPCNANWNAMRHNESSGYCLRCSAHVVDFTKMTDAEVLETLSGMSGKRCGRFTIEQVNRPVIKLQTAKPFLPFKALLAGFATFFGMKSLYAANNEGLTQVPVKFEQIDTTARRMVDTSEISNADTTAKMVVIRGRAG